MRRHALDMLDFSNMSANTKFVEESTARQPTSFCGYLMSDPGAPRSLD